MRLDQHTTPDGSGKYALVKLRQVRDILGQGSSTSRQVKQALQVLTEAGALDESVMEGEGEFFVIRLRDRHSTDALAAYARSAESAGDLELAGDVRELARRSGSNSPFLKDPD